MLLVFWGNKTVVLYELHLNLKALIWGEVKPLTAPHCIWNKNQIPGSPQWGSCQCLHVHLIHLPCSHVPDGLDTLLSVFSGLGLLPLLISQNLLSECVCNRYHHTQLLSICDPIHFLCGIYHTLELSVSLFV